MAHDKSECAQVRSRARPPIKSNLNEIDRMSHNSHLMVSLMTRLNWSLAHYHRLDSVSLTFITQGRQCTDSRIGSPHDDMALAYNHKLVLTNRT